MSRRVLVVEDQALMAMALQLALSGRCWEVETISGPTRDHVIEHAQRFQPQCVLLDIHLGGVGSGIELIQPLMATGAQVVMLTAEMRRMVLAECIEAGAAGWIGKGAVLDELRLERAGMQRAEATFGRLTHREALVLGALVDGLSADEIAEAHFVALTTVRSQIRAVLQKLNVRSQLAAVAVASAHRELLPHQVHAGRDRRRSHHGSRRCGPDFRS